MAFFGLGAGADVHERKVAGALERARRATQQAMQARDMRSFLIAYGDTMGAYGEAIAHQSSVMGRTTEVRSLISASVSAATTLQARAASKFSGGSMRRSASTSSRCRCSMPLALSRSSCWQQAAVTRS